MRISVSTTVRRIGYLRTASLALIAFVLLSAQVSAKDEVKEQNEALLKRVQQLEKQLADAQEQMKSLKATPIVTVAEGRAQVSCVVSR